MLSKQCSDESETVFIEELGICQGRTRIDVAVINGAFHGYEIKSDRDSLRRLPGQVKMYNKVVDKATLVVGQRHLDDSMALVSDWWGIIQVETDRREIRFRTIREGSNNPHIEATALVQLLWREDAIGLLDERGAAHGVRSKPRRVLWDRICEQFNVEEIALAVRAKLMDRSM